MRLSRRVRQSAGQLRRGSTDSIGANANVPTCSSSPAFASPSWNSAQLTPGEDEDLAAERTVLVNATRLACRRLRSRGRCSTALMAPRSIRCANAEARLDRSGGSLIPKLQRAARNDSCRRARISKKSARALSAYAAKVEADPGRLEQIEARLQELTQLKRKYGGSLESGDRNARPLAHRDRGTRRGRGVEGRRRNARSPPPSTRSRRTRKQADRASPGGAADLRRRMEAELKTLGHALSDASSRAWPVECRRSGLHVRDLALGPEGADTVEFHLSPNLGQPAMPLAQYRVGRRVVARDARAEAAGGSAAGSRRR